MQDEIDDQLPLDVHLNPGPPSPPQSRRRRRSGTAAFVRPQAAETTASDLFDSVLRLKGKPYFVALLDYVATRRQYSIFNTALIFQQRPTATLVGTPTFWARQKRIVREDARPIVIIRPGGPVCFVFDIADTEGLPDLFPRPDPHDVRGAIDEADWLEFLARVKRDRFFDVVEKELPWASAGSIGRLRMAPGTTTQRGKAFQITLSARHSPTQKAVTLAHELAHAFCGHLGQVEKCWWPYREVFGDGVVEFEAELAAWIVARRAGIEPNSVEYLYQYREEGVLQRISIDCVVRAANRIESLGFPSGSNSS